MQSDPADARHRSLRDFAVRALRWQLRSRVIDFPRRPLLMGIVNVTPDSFSDGGQFLDVNAAVAHALQLVVDGADLLVGQSDL